MGITKRLKLKKEFGQYITVAELEVLRLMGELEDEPEPTAKTE